jgi:hypothetical protein
MRVASENSYFRSTLLISEIFLYLLVEKVIKINYNIVIIKNYNTYLGGIL